MDSKKTNISRALALLAVGLVLAASQPTTAGTVEELAFGSGDHCDAGAGFGDEAGNCAVSCEPGSEMSANMTSRNGDPNRWVHAAISCGGGGATNTCPGEKYCDSGSGEAETFGKGWCHGAVENENGDWYRWKLYCYVGAGDQGLEDVVGDVDVPLDPTCESIPSEAKDHKGRHIIISGHFDGPKKLIFGEGHCTEQPASSNVHQVGSVLYIFA